MRSFNADVLYLYVVLILFSGFADLRAAPPVGSVTGTIEPKPAVQVTSVVAVNRATGDRFKGHWDAADGRFTISKVPMGATLDCIIDFKDVRLEGVNLTVPPSDYEEEQPLSEEDRRTIEEKVYRMNKFADLVEIKTIQGNIQHAAVLLNKLRTKPFFGSKPGEIIWRAELWHFECPEQTWLKVQDELFIVLYRERIDKSVYAMKSITFDPMLGGLKVTDEQSDLDLGVIRLPTEKTGVHFHGKREVKDESEVN